MKSACVGILSIIELKNLRWIIEKTIQRGSPIHLHNATVHYDKMTWTDHQPVITD